jgi:dienelactone hydrolase
MANWALRFVVLAVATLLQWPALAQDVQFPTAAVPGVIEPATIRGTVYKPKGIGPFPAVIVLHGCGGPDSHHRVWAERLVSWGYLALVPDSFGSRGHKSICEKTSLVPPGVRVADVVGAAEFLSTQPYVAKGRIGVIGFSHGGWTIIKGAQADAFWSAHGIKGAVAYYPYCTPKTDRNVAIPLLILMGDKDDWTPADRCKELIAGLRQPGLVEATFYPDTYHDFDRNQRTTWVKGLGADGKVTSRKLEYNSAATHDAEARTRAFFDKLLR